MKKFFKILMYVSAIVTLLNLVAVCFIVSMPKEDIVNIVEYKVYPPFMGDYVDRLHEKELAFEKSPISTCAMYDVKLAEIEVYGNAIVCIVVIICISYILFVIASEFRE